MITIGKHRLLCGDITDGAVSALMGDELADVVYSDPPWGPGMLQAFATMSERGSTPRAPWNEFLDAFCAAVAKHRKPEAPVFVEMGLRWVTDLDDAMARVGLPMVRRWEILYGPKKKPLPNALTLYGPRDVQVEMPSPPHGEPVTQAVLNEVVVPGAIVLDPCTGLGMTARITHRLEARFRGTELNPARLQRTVDWLRKQHA